MQTLGTISPCTVSEDDTVVSPLIAHCDRPASKMFDLWRVQSLAARSTEGTLISDEGNGSQRCNTLAIELYTKLGVESRAFKKEVPLKDDIKHLYVAAPITKNTDMFSACLGGLSEYIPQSSTLTNSGLMLWQSHLKYARKAVRRISQSTIYACAVVRDEGTFAIHPCAEDKKPTLWIIIP